MKREADKHSSPLPLAIWIVGVGESVVFDAAIRPHRALGADTSFFVLGERKGYSLP